MKKCAIITTSRADFGFLKHPAQAIKRSPQLELQMIVSGTHLVVKDHGYTVDEIIADGFEITERVPLSMQAHTDVDVARSTAEGVVGFAKVFAKHKPDIVILLGDRYEVFAASAAATISRIPIAHLCGGDVTEGAYDEVFRHSISKAAALHFPTNPDSARRLRQLGEPDDRIHMVGSTGLDGLVHMDWLTREQVFKKLDFQPRTRNIIITHHPVTREKGLAEKEIKAVLQALDHFGDDTGLIFTGVNADSEADAMSGAIKQFCTERAHAKLFSSLGQYLYMNVINQMDVVVGNSSSGLYEVPSLKKATINIGNRQAGRLKAASVIDTIVDPQSIIQAIERGLVMDCSQIESPYGNGYASEEIIKVLEGYSNFSHLVSKKFIDYELGDVIPQA